MRSRTSAPAADDVFGFDFAGDLDFDLAIDRAFGSRAAQPCLSMILPENRFPLFGIML